MAKLEAFAKTDAGKKKFGQQFNNKNSTAGYEYTQKLSYEFLNNLADNIYKIDSRAISEVLKSAVIVS